ncbi:MAG TPA: XrtA-associated tyrosine autokinase [Casimicrobiaceae bacterium]|nr:XrtA-associated tyrosine autokinase [Casimicrobiaceae bacterium]
MDLVEKAAARLAQLQKAGVEIPVPQPAAPAAAPEGLPTPERVMEALERAQASDPHSPFTAPPRSTPAGAAAMRGAASAHRSKVVQIDLDALAAAGFVTPQAQRAQIADEFRVIKRPIIKNARERSGARAERANLIMVTSAIPAEGKSFVALNLAMSIALEVDSTALLVDADVANPSLMHMTHLPPASKGLLDLLTDPDVKLHDVLLKTNVDKLTLLPAGTAHGRATEMLASESMAALLEEMASRYHDRILVFDSPPLLATTEARALASHMGQIVMVVEADRTTQVLVKHALETIESCPVVMMVLNKAPRPEVGSYYGHQYYSASATP